MRFRCCRPARRGAASDRALICEEERASRRRNDSRPSAARPGLVAGWALVEERRAGPAQGAAAHGTPAGRTQPAQVPRTRALACLGAIVVAQKSMSSSTAVTPQAQRQQPAAGWSVALTAPASPLEAMTSWRWRTCRSCSNAGCARSPGLSLPGMRIGDSYRRGCGIQRVSKIPQLQRSRGLAARYQSEYRRPSISEASGPVLGVLIIAWPKGASEKALSEMRIPQFCAKRSSRTVDIPRPLMASAARFIAAKMSSSAALAPRCGCADHSPGLCTCPSRNCIDRLKFPRHQHADAKRAF